LINRKPIGRKADGLSIVPFPVPQESSIPTREGKTFPLEWKQIRKKEKTSSTSKDKMKLERLKNS